MSTATAVCCDEDEIVFTKRIIASDPEVEWKIGMNVDWKHDGLRWVQARITFIMDLDQDTNKLIQVQVNDGSCSCNSEPINVKSKLVTKAGMHTSRTDAAPEKLQKDDPTPMHETPITCPRELERRDKWNIGTPVQYVHIRTNDTTRERSICWIDGTIIAVCSSPPSFRIRGLDVRYTDQREVSLTLSYHSICLRASNHAAATASMSTSLSYVRGEADYEYVDVESESFKRFLCSICLSVYRNPMLHTSCRNMFCGACLSTHRLSSGGSPNDRSCPLCRKQLSESSIHSAPLIMDSLLQDLRVKCKHCQHEMAHSKLASHWDQQCPLKCRFGCRQQQENCDAPISTFNGIKRLMEHESKQCANAVLECDATTRGCDWRGKVQEREEHLRTCVILRIESVAPRIKEAQNAYVREAEELRSRFNKLISDCKEAMEQRTAVLQVELATHRAEACKLPRISRNRMLCKVGAEIDCRDQHNRWQQASVKKLVNNAALISYVGRTCKEDEFVPLDSSALAPRGKHTFGDPDAQKAFYSGRAYTKCRCGEEPDCLADKPCRS